MAPVRQCGPPQPLHFGLNEKGSVPETLRYEGRLNMRSLGELTDLALPAADEDSAAASSLSSQQVGYAISNHVAFLERHLEFHSRLLEQTDLRFAAAAGLAEIRSLRFRMMQTIKDVVNVPAFRANSREHFALKCLEHFRPQLPLGDAGLV